MLPFGMQNLPVMIPTPPRRRHRPEAFRALKVKAHLRDPGIIFGFWASIYPIVGGCSGEVCRAQCQGEAEHGARMPVLGTDGIELWNVTLGAALAVP